MAGKRVAVLSPDGQFGTVDEADAEAVKSAGGRVLTAQQVADRQLQEAYKNAPLSKVIAHDVASVAAGPIAANALSGTGVTAAAPEVEAFQQGLAAPMTLGLDKAAVKGIVEATAGKDAARAYGQHQLAVAEASPAAKTLGEVAGYAAQAIGGSGSGLARAVPGLGVSALGGAAEAGAGRALAGLAARGVAGRAAATAGGFAARGATEMALTSAAQEFSDQVLGDHELAADKIFAAGGIGGLLGLAGGGAIGAGGSLAASGARAVTRAAGTGLSRAMGRVGTATEELVQGARSRLEGAVGETAARAEGAIAEAAQGADRAIAKSAEAAAPTIREALANPTDAAKKFAQDRAWRSTGGRKAFAAEANKYLPNGTNDVGEALLRHKVIDVEGGALQAGMNGTSEAIAERIAKPLATVGARLGEIAETSGARVPVTTIADAVDQVLRPLSKKAGFEGIENSVRSYGNSLLEKLGVTEANQSVRVQDLLFQRQALDDLIYKEVKSLDPGGRVEALREVRRSLEGAITDALDDASGKVAGELRSEYQALKHDYQALRIGQKAAEDAVTRGAANRSFSLTDKIIGSAVGATGAAIGGPIGGLVAGPGAAAVSKFVRERGDAALAVLFSRAADTGAIAKIVNQVNEQVTRAARGFLQGPRKGLPMLPAAEKPRVVADAMMKRVAAFQSDPEGFVNQITRDTEGMAGAAPNVASALTTRAVQAMTFLASKMPSMPEPDPLDPHGAPPMTDAQAREFASYARYVERPQLFLQELEHGKMTFEGAEVYRALVGDRPASPGGKTLWQELQEQTLDALATQMARGERVPYQRRVQLGLLLDAPATPAQRPEHMLYLQKVAGAPAQAPTAPAPSRSSSTKMPVQRSALDRLEMTGPGR